MAQRTALADVVIVSSVGDARAHVRQNAGSAAVVCRGRERSVLLECPCGCRDVLVINLDPGAGPFWRHRLTSSGLTLMPSVWRTSGCESHFVLWESRIWWGRTESDEAIESESPAEMDEELREEWRRIVIEGRGRPR